MRVRDVADPMPGAGEVLVRVAACGVDGTDRHIRRGEYPAALPVTLGHEFAGTVAAVGPGVTLGGEPGSASSDDGRDTGGSTPRDPGAALVGTRVTVDPNISCGRCRECRRGEVCLCPHRVALGVDLDGGLATFVRVPASQIYALPEAMPAEWGALCEPLACCLHGLDLVGIQPGMSVAVLGGGVIGQLMVQLARLAGATSIVLITRQASRRALAERLGATATVDPHAGDVVDAITGPGGAAPGGVDVALECAGTVETFEQSIALARRGGTVLIFGVTPQDERARISPFDVFARELRILGSYLNPLTHGRAVALAASGRLDLDALITRRLSLDEIPAALAAPPAPGEVKSIVLPS